MKNINSNKTWPISFATGLILMLGFTACKKNFLDRDPQGSYTYNDYPFPQGSGPYDQFVFGAYASLRQYGFCGSPMIATNSIRSDDADKGSTPADGPSSKQFDEFPVLPSNGLVNTFWVDHFNAIANCNLALQKVNNDTVAVNEPFKNQARAEARFIRAFCYFELVRAFGDVPKFDTATTIPKNVPRTPATDIYTFIETDLQFAANNLPLTYPSSFIGRLTSGAAKGMLAKVYLTRGNWAMAMNMAGQVISSNIYNLNTPYTDIFKEIGENTSESVFEIQAVATSTPGQQASSNYGTQYANDQGFRGSGVLDLGFGFNNPNNFLKAAYDTNAAGVIVDPRYERTFLRLGETTYYGETMVGAPNSAYNEKVYTNPAVRNKVGNQKGWWMNIRVLRYADVVLMYAEAANELGGVANIADARAKVNMVRARARIGAPNGTLPDLTTTDQNALRASIRLERRLELAMELDRFYDLVRWGTAQTVLSASGRPNFNAARDVLLPVPQPQIDISGGVLTQNPNY